MLTFLLIAAAVSAAAAVTLTLLGFTRWIIVGLAAVLITFGVTPATVAIGENVARAAASTYNEYYNGYELAATDSVTTCYRDGSCSNTYQCDEYTTYTTEYDHDSKGNITGSHQVAHYHYHDCPQSTQETSYYVNTTLGQYTIAAHQMTGRRWRSDADEYFHQTTPSFWLAAQKRIKANKPGPVTQVNTYQNFILASQTSLFKRYSSQISGLTKKGLLPAPSMGVVNFYDASKAYFVGKIPAGVNEASLIKDVAYLNGATGAKLQGDVHIVFVNASQVGDPTDYLNSLMAYWQSPAFGHNDISKNSIVIAVGVGTASQLPATQAAQPSATPTPAATATASAAITPALKPTQPVALWVRAATGMPVGNEAMLVDLRNTLEGQPINSNFIGRPEMDVKTQAIVHTTGLTENVIFGPDKFARVSMNADGKIKGASDLGYKYLQASIPIAPSAYVVMAIIIAIIGAGLLLLSAYLSAMMSASSNSNYTSRRYTSNSRY